MPGDKYRSIKRPDVYRALRRQGHDKSTAAAIANATANGTIDRTQKEAIEGSITEADMEENEYDAELVEDETEDTSLPRARKERVSGEVDLLVTIKEQGDTIAALTGHAMELARAVHDLLEWKEKAQEALIELIGETPTSVLASRGFTSPAAAADHSAFNIGDFGSWVKAQKERGEGEAVTNGLAEFMSFATNGKGPAKPPRT